MTVVWPRGPLTYVNITRVGNAWCLSSTDPGWCFRWETAPI